MKRHVFRPAAAGDVERAYAWYEQQREGLGEEFLAEVIEEYPEDKYSPSALLLGFTSSGRPLHIQVSTADAVVTRIITVYEPDRGDWTDFRRRR